MAATYSYTVNRKHVLYMAKLWDT